MNLSPNGLRLIKQFEGYHRRLPNGDCIAYRCPAGVWTLGYGSTGGIRPGMIWTEDQAEAALARDAEAFEAAVTRLVTAPINQNQFDALVSFTYNCGEGALTRSSLLKRLNARDYAGAARAFAAWNKGGGRVLPGLVARRAREAALFLEGAPTPSAEPAQPDMPQQVDAPPEAPQGSRKGRIANWFKWLFGGGAVTNVAYQAADTVSTAQGVLSPFKAFLAEYGLVLLLLVTIAGLLAALAWQHFQQEDYETGRYAPREDQP